MRTADYHPACLLCLPSCDSERRVSCWSLKAVCRNTHPAPCRFTGSTEAPWPVLLRLGDCVFLRLQWNELKCFYGRFFFCVCFVVLSLREEEQFQVNSNKRSWGRQLCLFKKKKKKQIDLSATQMSKVKTPRTQWLHALLMQHKGAFFLFLCLSTVLHKSEVN